MGALTIFLQSYKNLPINNSFHVSCALWCKAHTNLVQNPAALDDNDLLVGMANSQNNKIDINLKENWSFNLKKYQTQEDMFQGKCLVLQFLLAFYATNQKRNESVNEWIDIKNISNMKSKPKRTLACLRLLKLYEKVCDKHNLEDLNGYDINGMKLKMTLRKLCHEFKAQVYVFQLCDKTCFFQWPTIYKPDRPTILLYLHPKLLSDDNNKAHHITSIKPGGHRQFIKALGIEFYCLCCHKVILGHSTPHTNCPAAKALELDRCNTCYRFKIVEKTTSKQNKTFISEDSNYNLQFCQAEAELRRKCAECSMITQNDGCMIAHKLYCSYSFFCTTCQKRYRGFGAEKNHLCNEKLCTDCWQPMPVNDRIHSCQVTSFRFPSKIKRLVVASFVASKTNLGQNHRPIVACAKIQNSQDKNVFETQFFGSRNLFGQNVIKGKEEKVIFDTREYEYKIHSGLALGPNKQVRKEQRLSVVSRDEEPELSLVRFLLHRSRNCTTCILHSNNDMMLVLRALDHLGKSSETKIVVKQRNILFLELKSCDLSFICFNNYIDQNIWDLSKMFKLYEASELLAFPNGWCDSTYYKYNNQFPPKEMFKNPGESDSNWKIKCLYYDNHCHNTFNFNDAIKAYANQQTSILLKSAIHFIEDSLILQSNLLANSCLPKKAKTEGRLAFMLPFENFFTKVSFYYNCFLNYGLKHELYAIRREFTKGRRTSKGETQFCAYQMHTLNDLTHVNAQTGDQLYISSTSAVPDNYIKEKKLAQFWNGKLKINLAALFLRPQFFNFFLRLKFVCNTLTIDIICVFF
jgi:hypothetical protein